MIRKQRAIVRTLSLITIKYSKVALDRTKAL